MAIQGKPKLEKKFKWKKKAKKEAAVRDSTVAEREAEQIVAQKLEFSRNKLRNHGKLVRQRQQKRDREFEISYKQILSAADQGKKWAIVELGAYAEYQRDYNRAIEQYEKLAAQGDLYYMRRIAVIFEQSLENVDSAIDWYTEAGHYGDEYSMIRAANLLELHFEDYDEAVAWYRKAAQAGNFSAIYHLCRVYQHNLHNLDIVIEWYQRAFQLGDLKAAIALGQLYENSLKDYPKAVEWYSVAASHKSLYAVNLLCQLYETKLCDYLRAIEWYKTAIALYNQQNGNGQVHAADSQGQYSLNQMSKDSSPPHSSSAEGAAVSSSSQPIGEAAMQSPAQADVLAQMTSPNHDLSEDLLPRPEDLTPAEIASAYGGVPDEAEVEFLG